MVALGHTQIPHAHYLIQRNIEIPTVIRTISYIGFGMRARLMDCD